MPRLVRASIRFFIPAIVIILMSGCNQDASLQKRVKELESKVAETDNTISELATAVFDIQMGLQEPEATLDVSSKGYEISKSNLGNFLVSLKDIKPYGDGQKINMAIGNPYNITFNGFTLKVTYSRRMPDFPKSQDPEIRKAWREESKKFRESIKEKTFNMTDLLSPGRWNHASVVIAPAKPEEVGSIRIKIITNQVMLYGK